MLSHPTGHLCSLVPLTVLLYTNTERIQYMSVHMPVPAMLAQLFICPARQNYSSYYAPSIHSTMAMYTTCISIDMFPVIKLIIHSSLLPPA